MRVGGVRRRDNPRAYIWSCQTDETTSFVKCLHQGLCYSAFFPTLFFQIWPTKWHGSIAPIFFFPYCFVLIFPEKAILIAHMWQLSDKIKVYVILERVWYIHTKLSLRKQLCRKGLQLESLHHIKFLLFFSVWEYSLGCLSPLTQLLPAAQERHSIKTHVLTDHSELMNEGVNVERSKPFVLLPLQAGTCSGRENCFVTTSTWEGGLGRLHSWQR